MTATATDGETGTGGAVLAGTPWWVRAISLVGVPSVIAVGLVYQMATGMERDIRAVRQDHEQLTQNIERHQATTTRLLEQLVALAAATCRNTAQNETERVICDSIAVSSPRYRDPRMSLDRTGLTSPLGAADPDPPTTAPVPEPLPAVVPATESFDLAMAATPAALEAP
jgi:hypothetical protein